MKIEHKYFMITQQGERNNLVKLHEYMMDGWIPARETSLEKSSERVTTEGVSSNQDFSHCLILLYRETK